MGVQGKLVFTGGIGEHSSEIRERVCDCLGWLGIEIDQVANRVNGPLLTSVESRVRVWVIPTNEELIIGRHTGLIVQQA